ncbi:MAG: hypothetical protein JXJ04_08850 [Spirochaetales bacterium]|nr:hypothetical protein [Spirochaetales bacterium]
MNKKSLIFLLIVLFISFFTFAESQDDPLWVIVEKGKAELRKKEYGNALTYFKAAIMQKEEYPEVYVLIGDIYRISDNPLAMHYYRQAYDLRHFFEIPRDTYTVLYKLAFLYKAERNYREYESMLKTALAEDKTYLKEFFTPLKDDYFRIFTSKGLDRLLVLYRILGNQHMIQAHAELGWYNYKTGMYKESIIHSLFALVLVVSEAYKEVRYLKPMYDYVTMEDFLLTGLQYSHISKFLLQEANIYELLYYLGCATYVESGYIPAKSIWTIVAQSPVPNSYKERAKMQIQAPQPEKLIDIPKDIDYDWDF